MSALLTTGSIGLKLGILIATGLCCGGVGYRLGRDLDTFMVVDRFPLQQALRLADRGLDRGDLLTALLERHEPADRAKHRRER